MNSMIKFCVDVYRGDSIVSREFDTLGQAIEFLFEIENTDYSNINIYKYENENDPLPCDFTGNSVDL